MGKQIGKVIKIPNDSTLIVSKKVDCVAVGDIVIVYEVADKITDPDTKEDLGTYDFAKAKLEVTEVYDKYFVCQKIARENVSGFNFALSPLLKNEILKSIETLNVDPKQNDNLKIKDIIIHIGDLVKSI